jgi:hypothetical protein
LVVDEARDETGEEEKEVLAQRRREEEEKEEEEEEEYKRRKGEEDEVGRSGKEEQCSANASSYSVVWVLALDQWISGAIEP